MRENVAFVNMYNNLDTVENQCITNINGSHNIQNRILYSDEKLLQHIEGC